MELKDHYSILELPPSATAAEIKKAYRRLAHIFHPDKNAADPYAAARFAEIKEAYEILTDPSKKEYYLQQRWYNQSIGKKRTQGIITPETMLKQVLELEKYVSRLDVFRMDKQGLHNYMEEMFSDDTISKLNTFMDPDMTEKIIQELLKCLNPLPLPLALSLQGRFQKLNMPASAQGYLTNYFTLRRKNQQREKYEVWILALIVAGICLLIYFSGRR